MEQVIIAVADPKPHAPSWPIRSGGWDTHAHVFGPLTSFPIGDDRPYTSPDQVAVDYLAMLDAIQLRHGVLVQPSVYGHDNSCLLDALREHPGRLFGVVDFDVLKEPDAALEALWQTGVRGLRVRPSAHRRDWLIEVASRLRGSGWHLDMLFDAPANIAELAPTLRQLRIDVMIEAMGSPRAGQALDEPGFQALLELLREETAWVKLSHAYHIDATGPPYAAATPFANAIVQAAPHRAVWGSDWPHPMRDGVMPNDGDLIDLLPVWSGSSAASNQILSVNPTAFYRPHLSKGSFP